MQMKWYLMAFQKYGIFSGRSRRKEYWMFYLFNMIAAFIIGFAEATVFGDPSPDSFGPISAIYLLAIILPFIALSVRRLHDTDHSGWWIFINFVPLVGPFWYLWLMCKSSDHARNRFGEDPTAGDITEPAG